MGVFQRVGFVCNNIQATEVITLNYDKKEMKKILMSLQKHPAGMHGRGWVGQQGHATEPKFLCQLKHCIYFHGKVT